MSVKEADLAKPMVQWLRSNQWEVFQEVEAPGGICDIVARCGAKIWAIEVKNTLSFQLLDQVMGWRYKAHFVSICVPSIKKRPTNFLLNFSAYSGIGIFFVRKENLKFTKDPNLLVYRFKDPKMHRRIRNDLKDCLNEAQKYWSRAGSSGGRRWTPFQQTVADLTNVVQKHPGIPLKEAIQQISPHYSSEKIARTSLSFHLRENPHLLPGVRAEREGRLITLYPQGQEYVQTTL